MPGSSRSAQVSLDATPYYHCVARCVRRAWLCGRDAYTGKSFEHRKPWVLERLKLASSAFAIDVCAYAVMSNHLHLVLRVAAERATSWDDDEVARRYKKLFPGVVKRAAVLPEAVRAEHLSLWRERLTSLSWFMRFVCEHIARRANREDQCTGRFWEGRFKSQALLDEAALLTVMSYVDLNPVRAGIASSPRASEFTSIKQRIEEAHRGRAKKSTSRSPRPSLGPTLAPMRNQVGRSANDALPISTEDYRELLAWTAHAVGDRADSKAKRPPRWLASRKIDADEWRKTMRLGGLEHLTTLGTPKSISLEAERRNRRWLRGKGFAATLFQSSS